MDKKKKDKPKIENPPQTRDPAEISKEEALLRVALNDGGGVGLDELALAINTGSELKETEDPGVVVPTATDQPHIDDITKQAVGAATRTLDLEESQPEQPKEA